MKLFSRQMAVSAALALCFVPVTPAVSTAATPAVLQQGSSGRLVGQLQLALGTTADGKFGPATKRTLNIWEGKYGYPQDGRVVVGSREWLSIFAKPKTATKYDKRCLMAGRVACVSRSGRWTQLFLDGKPYYRRISSVTGRPGFETPSGTWPVFRKEYNGYSEQYDAPMPRSVYFHQGKAFHYSHDYVREGDRRIGSHGCVNLRSWDDANTVYDFLRVGDKVVVLP